MKLFILLLCFTSSLCGKYYHENKLWGQPCIDDNSVPSPSKSAEEVVRYTTWIHEQLDSYKDLFISKLEKHHATFHEYFQFTEAKNEPWLRDFYWFIEEILPKEKLLFQPLPGKFIADLKSRTHDVDDVMPKINAALKYLLGCLYEIVKLPANVQVLHDDLDLKRSIKESMRIHKSIICSMENYLKAKKLEIHYLLDDFLPKNIAENVEGLILRDTFNYFEYINQLFETLQVKDGSEIIVLLDDPRPSWMENATAAEWKYKLMNG